MHAAFLKKSSLYEFEALLFILRYSGFEEDTIGPVLGVKERHVPVNFLKEVDALMTLLNEMRKKNKVRMLYGLFLVFRAEDKDFCPNMPMLCLLESDCRLLRVLPGSLDTGMSTLKSP